jgi:hypothetical protein
LITQENNKNMYFSLPNTEHFLTPEYAEPGQPQEYGEPINKGGVSATIALP